MTTVTRADTTTTAMAGLAQNGAAIPPKPRRKPQPGVIGHRHHAPFQSFQKKASNGYQR
jgi:hypothetical protein